MNYVCKINSLFFSRFSSKTLSMDEKLKLLQNTKLSPSAAKFFFSKCNDFDLFLRMYILQGLKNREDFLYQFLYYFETNLGPDREHSLNSIIKKKNKVLNLAYNGKLFKEELEKIYHIYHQEFLKKAKFNFRAYYQFCVIFKNYLNQEEKEKLYSYLLNKKYWHFIELALKEIKFNNNEKNKLNSLLITQKLLY